MKLKGRRQSKNVIDKRDERLSDKDWDKLEKEGFVNDPFRVPLRPSKKAARELEVIDFTGRTPTPTPKPTRIQVTPGKWKTVNSK